MIIIMNKVVPFGGYKAMMVWPFLFVKRKLTMKELRREMIYSKQQIEMLIVFFYLWYLFEWLYRSVVAAFKLPPTEKKHCFHVGYRNISFEREAYFFENDADYLNRRKHYAWTWWLKTRY